MNESTQKLLLNALREASIKWEGRSECLKRARQQRIIGHNKKNGWPKLKYFWLCAKCNEWFDKEKSMEVDHIIEIGTFSGNFDRHIKLLFCGQDNLQCLCVGCHLKKTIFANSTRKYQRKTTQE